MKKYIKYIIVFFRFLYGIFNSFGLLLYLLYAKLITKKQNSSEKKLKNINSISFCGGGFKCLYQLGVYNGLKSVNQELAKDLHYIGVSAGAFSAAMCCCNVDIDNKLIPFLMNLTCDFRDDFYGNITSMSKRMKSICEECLPENSHILASGRCHILVLYLTSNGFSKEIISEFNSKDDLINCILASEYVPIWSDINLFKYRGKYCIDAGIIDNYPVLDTNTVTVSFNNSGNICPEIDYDKTMSTFIPQKQNIIKDMVSSGKKDGIFYLNSNDSKKKWKI